MKKLLLVLFCLYASLSFGQDGQAVDIRIPVTGVSVGNSDSLGGEPPSFYVDTATAQNIRGVKDFIDVINANSGLQFVPTSGISHSEGLIFYDTITNTFSGFIDRTDVTLNIGEENWLRVVNKSGGALSDGQAVYISGAQGNRPTILMAKADALSTSQGTIAVLTENINDNDEGIATTFGLVSNFNTAGFTAGDELFLSPTSAGDIVNVKPTAPNFVIRIGWALNSTPNGAILVNISVYGDGTNNTFIDQDVTSTGSPVFEAINIDDSLLLVSFDTLYKESLNETDFTTSTKWTTFGNFSVSGGKAVFSGTSGTIRQKKADLLIEGIATKTYQFTYTADSIDWIGCIAFINTDFASANDTLVLSDGTHITTFTSNSDPVDFKIECTCTSGDFTLDDVSLKIKSDSIVFVKNDIYAGGIFAGSSIFSGDVQIEGTLRGGSPLKISPSIQFEHEGDTVIMEIDTIDGGLSLNYRVHIHSKDDKPGSVCFHPGTSMPIVNNNFGYRLWADSTIDKPRWLLPNADTSIKVNYNFVMEDASGNVGIGTSSPDELLHSQTSGANALQYSLKLENPNNIDGGGTATGILFNNGTTVNYGKGGLVYERSASFGRGDFHFLQNTAATSAKASLSDIVFTIKNDGLLVFNGGQVQSEIHINHVSNTFFGFDAGNSGNLSNAGGGDNGWRNTFIGNNAGYSTTTGLKNTFIGEQAGFDNTTGIKNTGLGRTALNNNIAGNANTCIGQSSGFSLTGGDDNILIGVETGYPTLVTGSRNIIIGSFIDAVANTNDQLNIGDAIYGDLSTGYVGIGETNPGEKLEIAGNVKVTGDIYSTAWTDYGGTSTIVGWSGTPTAYIWYKKIGNLVYVNFSIAGTSNATNISFTLPYIAVNSANAFIRVACSGRDNGSFLATPAQFYLDPNSATAGANKDFSGAAWTASGIKEIRGQFWYEAQ